jgi:hypothetical protein
MTAFAWGLNLSIPTDEEIIVNASMT